MKTVIQVVQHLSPGGIEVMALELKKMNQKNAKMLIVSLEGNKEEQLAKWPRLSELQDDLIFMNKKSGIDVGLIPKLAALFKRYQASSVHSHHIGPLIYGGVAARLAKVKHLIHTEHDAWHLEDKKRRIVQRLILSLVRPTLVADAETVASCMRAHLKRNDIVVVKNGINVEHFRPGNKMLSRKALDLPLGARVVGSCGRMEKVKGHETLIRSLVHLDTHIHIALAGSGSLRQPLEDLAHKLKVRSRVHFVGQIDDMPEFYQALDVFCLPSFREGMPLAPLEAQACGIPAVVSDTGGAHEALCSQAGMLVGPGDAEGLAQALDKVLKRELSQRHICPRAFVQKNGNVKIMAKAYAKLCKIDNEAA